MNPDKRSDNKLSARQPGSAEFESAGNWLADDQAETRWSSNRRYEARSILSRAAMVYLVLFMALGLVMSAMGVNPLANNGLMPKTLLVFVGLSLLIALANSLSNSLHEPGRSWLGLVRGLIRIAIYRK